MGFMVENFVKQSFWEVGVMVRNFVLWRHLSREIKTACNHQTDESPPQMTVLIQLSHSNALSHIFTF